MSSQKTKVPAFQIVALLITLVIGGYLGRSLPSPRPKAQSAEEHSLHDSPEFRSFQASVKNMYGGVAASVENQDWQQVDDENGDYGPTIELTSDPKVVKHPLSVFERNGGVNVGFASVPLRVGAFWPRRYALAGLWKNDPICIYLHHTKGADATKGWGAQYSKELNGDNECHETLHDTPTWPLPVAAEQVRDPATGTWHVQDHYLGVARIEEGTMGEIVFGSQCGAAWCHVGVSDTSHVRRPEFTNTGETENERSRIPAWFDDQALAVTVTESDGTVRLDRSFRAQIVPEPGLGTYVDSNFRTKDDTIGIKVARIYAPRDPRGGTRYHNTGVRKGWNDVYLRWNGKALDYSGFLIDPAGVRHKFRGVKQVPLGLPKGTILPGTARWAWGNDEGIWIACDVGCCTLEFEL